MRVRIRRSDDLTGSTLIRTVDDSGLSDDRRATLRRLVDSCIADAPAAPGPASGAYDVTIEDESFVHLRTDSFDRAPALGALIEFTIANGR